MKKSFASFEEFWPFYLSQHSNRTCRNLHFLGTLLGMAFLLNCLIKKQYVLLPICFVFGYGFSWVGHFFFEKNRPATFIYPRWSFIGDFKMLNLFLTGGLKEELKRHQIGADK
jgi:hypothetical protein